MSEVSSSKSTALPVASADSGACCLRLSLLCLFLSAAIWAVAGSAFALIASIKFHQPNFLADCSCLTYGRVRPAFLTAMLYGFCIQAGLGVALWLLSRVGRAALAQPWMVLVGAKLWNIGVLVGVLGILFGHGTGFEYLDMPGYAAWIMMLGYLLIGVSAMLTFHNRTERALQPTQWFLLAALFWFPWIFSTAELLVVAYPVRGMAQAAIWWWYQANVNATFFTLAGLAAVFYFLPTLTNRPLHSRHLALFTFWLLILFSGWGGVPNSAPLPAWMPALGTIATVLTLVPLVTVVLNVHYTLEGKCSRLMTGGPLRFIGVGVFSFVVVGVLRAAGAVADVNLPLGFTWFTPALAQLNYYGFFAMVMFGAIYVVIPEVVGPDLLCPKLVRAHFWLALLGVVFYVAPLVVGGALQAGSLNNPTMPFVQILKGTIPFLRVSTMGDLFFGVGNILFGLNLVAVTVKFYRPKAVSAYGAATAELFTAEVSP